MSCMYNNDTYRTCFSMFIKCIEEQIFSTVMLLIYGKRIKSKINMLNGIYCRIIVLIGVILYIY